MADRHLPVRAFNQIKKTFQADKQNGFVTAINSRNVHAWLEVKTEYAKWIKRRIEKYGFEERVDYCVTIAKVGVRSNVEQTDYHCTPDMVKQLAMVESTEKGKVARLYFLDCEKIAQDKQKEIAAREEARMDYKPMNIALNERRAELGKDTVFHHYCNEADMINGIVLGCKSGKYRRDNGIEKNEPIRDHLTTCQIEAISDLQKINTSMIKMEMEYQERKKALTKLFNKNHGPKLLSELEYLEA